MTSAQNEDEERSSEKRGDDTDRRLGRIGQNTTGHVSHDQEGRAENLRRSANVAKFLNESGLICCAAFVAPNKDSREHAQSVIGKEHCIIVYLNPSLEVCRLRDPSGLYAAAELSGSPDLPGVSFPYDEPENPDLVLDTERLSVEKCITQLVKLLKSRKII